MVLLSEILQNAVVLRNAKRSLKVAKSPDFKDKVGKSLAKKVQSSNSVIIVNLEKLIEEKKQWFSKEGIDPDKLNVIKVAKKASKE